MENPSAFTKFLHFLIVIALLTFKFNGSFAKQRSSLILGLTRSTTSLPIPKDMAGLTKRPADLVEPLWALRDGYVMSLNIGTPTQVIHVYMDTGSDLNWVPCGNLSFSCIDCDDYRKNKMTATYSPSYSSTSTRVLCGSSFCADVHSSDNYFDTCTMAGCSLTTLLKSTCLRPCPSFAYTYGAGGVITGILSRDKLTVHGNKPAGVLKEIPEFSFGCVGSTYREPLGIAGFGRGYLSLPSQLGFLDKGFSYCFLPFKFANNPNISSPLVIGGEAIAPVDNLQFTPMLRNPLFPNYYYIGVEAIAVGNVSAAQVPFSLKEFDSQGNGGLLIDSGTTYTHLPEPFYSELLSVLQSVVTYPRAQEQEERTGFDLCYNVPSPNNNIRNEFPPITFHFSENVSLALPQENSFYAVSAPSNSTVVKCLLFQRMDGGNYGPAGVLGSFQQQNVKVVYDLEKEKIGFQPEDCASAASFQGLHKN